MWFGWIVFLIIGMWLGRRLADLQTVLMARRVKNLIQQKRKFQEESGQWDEIVEQNASSGVVTRSIRRFVAGPSVVRAVRKEVQND